MRNRERNVCLCDAAVCVDKQIVSIVGSYCPCVQGTR